MTDERHPEPFDEAPCGCSLYSLTYEGHERGCPTRKGNSLAFALWVLVVGLPATFVLIRHHLGILEGLWGHALWVTETNLWALVVGLPATKLIGCIGKTRYAQDWDRIDRRLGGYQPVNPRPMEKPPRGKSPVKPLTWLEIDAHASQTMKTLEAKMAARTPPLIIRDAPEGGWKHIGRTEGPTEIWSTPDPRNTPTRLEKPC